MKFLLMLGLVSSLLFSASVNAQTTTVFGPQKFQAGMPKAASYVKNFPASSSPNGTLKITNGNGLDISYLACSGNYLKILLCDVENFRREILVMFDRPKQIEIFLNNQKLSFSLPQTKGQIQIPIQLASSNQLKINLTGMPTASVTIQAIEQKQVPNILPVAEFSATPTSGFTPIVVSFSAALSRDPDGSIISYDWDFGDGGTGSGIFINHTFVNGGTYPVKLTVTDNSNAKTSKTYYLTYTHNDPPVSNFVATLNTGVGILNVKFDGSTSSDSDGSIAAYSWSFGDGQTSSDAVVEHIYTQPDQYSVSLTVTDDRGATTTSTQTIQVFDLTPPIIETTLPTAGQIFYTNKLPLSIQVHGSSNEPLSSVKVGLNDLSILNTSNEFDGFVSINQAGSWSIDVVAKDLWGNGTTASIPITIVFDDQPPVLAVNVIDRSITNQYSFDLPIAVTDANSVTTHIIVNGVELLQTGSMSLTYPASLSIEGENTITVVSVDIAGNSTTVSKKIIRDTTAPILSSLSPSDGSSLPAIRFPVSGTSNEPLSAASIGSLSLTLSADKLSFSGEYVSSQVGAQTLTFHVVDIAGNIADVSVNVTVSNPLLIPSLVSVVPLGDNTHFAITGSMNAVRSGANVHASGALFGNSGNATADQTGAFQIVLTKFNSADITVTDPSTNETAQMTVTLQSNTTLAGIVKDSSDTPLANVNISISGSALSVVTDGTGAFIFQNPPTGNQTLVIDGSTATQSTTGSNRSYSKTKLDVNIGIGQTNTLLGPIYLTPLILDGSETLVSSGSSAAVSSTYAPGVELQIPSSATIFPDGSNSGKINIVTVNSKFVTTPVPSNFTPTNVVSLEPSGTKFSSPVALTLPNDNNLPPETPMAILSMDSSSGKWVLDGKAKVSSDGQSVITLPGNGITHFSSVYAVPLAPLISTVKNPNLVGIDVNTGGLKNSVSAPSFKVLGASIAPTLIYNNLWANPTAYVSNMFAIPKQINSSSGSVQGSTSRSGSTRVTNCWPVTQWPISWEDCASQWVDWAVNTSYTDNWQSQNLWVPQTIKSQFYVSNIASDGIFDNSSAIGSAVNKITGSAISNASATDLIQQIGGAKPAVITYSLPLINSSTGDYLTSGIYPSLARYEVTLANLTITTNTISEVQTVVGNGQIISTTRNNTVSNQIDQQVMQLMPSDIQNDLLVQNKVNSSAGRGWQIAAASRIYNPTNTKVMIEESAGNLATYSLNNVIDTLYSSNGQDIDLAHGLDLSEWPYARAGSYTDSGRKSYIAQIDLSNPQAAPVNLGQASTYQGNLADQGYYQCSSTQNCDGSGCYPVYSGTFKSVMLPYSTKAIFGGFVKSSSGEIFATDTLSHSMYRQTGATLLLGQSMAVDNSPIVASNRVDYGGDKISGSLLVPAGIYSTYFNANPALVPNPVDAACNQYFGSTCGSGQMLSTVYDCSLANVQRTCGIHSVCSRGTCNNVYYCTIQKNPQFFYTASQGQVGASSSDTNGLNSPTFVIGSPSGKIILADTGNNRVLSVDPSTGATTLIGGNGQNFYTGDGGPATTASLFHPKGLVYDGDGNLYVATEDGYIRKIDTQGNISTYAGLALTAGGQVTSQGPASAMAFNDPHGLVIDSINQFMYVADYGNNRVVQIDMNTGIGNQVAGNNSCTTGTSGAAIGDGGAALNASLCAPSTVGLDAQNNLIIADSGHNSIRRVTFNGATAGKLAFAPSNSDLSSLFKNADGSWTRIYRNGSFDSFDNSGFQTSNTDRVGRLTSYSYDADHNLLKVQYPNGKALQFNYSGGLLNSIQDPAGRVTSLRYSGNFLQQINFPDGTKKTYDYDSKGMMLHQNDQRGNSTAYAYNEWNRLSKVTNPDGGEQNLTEWNSMSVVDNSTDPTNPQPTSGVGSGAGQASTVMTDAMGGTVTMTPDYMGYMSTITDALGNKTVITRDFQGRPLTVTAPDQTTTAMTYDPTSGDLLKTVDNATGIFQSKTYDIYGNTLTQSSGDANGTYATKSTSNTYDQNSGLLLQVKYPAGNTVSYQYNNLGLVTLKTVQNNGSNIATTYTYDNDGNVLTLTTSDGLSTSFTYDLAGNQITATSTSTGADTLTTLYSYDPFNRIVSVTTPKNEVTSYAYLPTGELTQIVDPKGNKATFQYDVNGRLISKTDPLNFAYVFAYDKNGNRTQETDPNGNVKRFSYDVLNRMTQATLPDDLLTYGYDSKGNVISAANNVSQLAATMDSRGRVVYAQTKGLGALSNYPAIGFTYSFDDMNNRTQLKTSTGSTVSYGYDSNNHLTGIASISGNFSFGYNIAGHLTGISRPGSASVFAYTNAGVLSSIQHNGANGSDYEIMSYDKRYFPTSKRTPAGTYNYGYDPNGQLTSASNPNAGVSAESYSYDNLGNRLSDGFGGTYSYDSNLQRFSDDSTYSYVYDNNGNVLRKLAHDPSKESLAFTYNSKNQLIQTQVFVGALTGVKRQMNYTYDVLGRRMQKVVLDASAPGDSTKSYTRNYIYDGQNIFYEADGSGVTLVQYTHSPGTFDDVLSASITTAGVSAGLAQNAGNYYYLKDHLGSIASIADSSGNIVQKYDYRAYGKIISIRNSSGVDISSNPVVNTTFTYTGREWEAESGLFFYRARYYDASIGRFLQSDQDAGKIGHPLSVVNKYIYGGNTPTMFTDPTGKDLFGEIFGGLGVITGIVGLIIAPEFAPAWGALIGASLGIIDNAANGGNWAGQVLGGALGGFYFGVSGWPGLIAAGATIGKAAATNGNFFENLAGNGNLLTNNIFIGGLLANIASNGLAPVITDPIITTVFSVGGAINTGVGLLNAECDPATGGAYSSDLCSASRTYNGN